MNYDEILIFTWTCDVVWYIIILIIGAPFLLFGGFLDRFLCWDLISYLGVRCIILRKYSYVCLL